MFRLIRFLVVLAFALVSVLYLFLLFVDLNHFKEPIERELAYLLDRRVKVESIDLKMSLTPSLSVKGVQVYNAKEFNEKATFAKVDEMDLSFALLPLFKGQVQLDDIFIHGGSILLIEKDGKNNWTFASSESEENTAQQTSAKETSSQTNLLRYYLHYISLKNMDVTYVSGDMEEKVSIRNATLTQMKNFFAHLIYKNTPLQITLASDTLIPSLLEGRLDNFAFNINLKGGDIKVAGNIGNLTDLKEIDLRVEGSVSDFDQFLKSVSMGAKLPEISKKTGTFSSYITGELENLNVKELKAKFSDLGHLNLTADIQNITTTPKVSLKGDLEVKSTELANKYGLQPISVDFNSLYDNKTILLNKVSVFINKTDLQLAGSVDLSKQIPFVKGSVYSEYFNFEDIVVQDELSLPTIQTKQTTSQKKQEEIDFSFLKMLNADVKIKFENLKLIDKGYHKANIHLLLNEGTLVANPFSLDLLSGDIMGNLKLQSQTEVPEINLYVKGVGLMISELDFVKPYLKDSPANMVVELQSKGTSPDSLLGNLNGVVELQIPSGVIVNKWFNSLPAAIGAVTKNSAFSYSGDEYYSRLSCAALKLDIKDGVIHSDKNIALETSLINLTVSGNIDLKKKYLSLSLIPSINQMNNKLNKKLSFAQYVKLQGPFSKIEMKEDVKGVAKDVVSKKLTKLAQKVAGVDTPKEEVIPVGGLCQKALGLEVVQPVVEKKEATEEKTTTTSKPSLKDVKNSLKDQVKIQLEKSLTNILKKN